MTEATEIRNQISEAAVNFEEHYECTLREIRELKTLMNELERSLNEKNDNKTADNVSRLEGVTEELDILIDSTILRSEKQWEKFHELENASKPIAQKLDELNDLRNICERTEALAKDLLCFSLGRFRKSDR